MRFRDSHNLKFIFSLKNIFWTWEEMYRYKVWQNIFFINCPQRAPVPLQDQAKSYDLTNFTRFLDIFKKTYLVQKIKWTNQSIRKSKISLNKLPPSFSEKLLSGSYQPKWRCGGSSDMSFNIVSIITLQFKSLLPPIKHT